MEGGISLGKLGGKRIWRGDGSDILMCVPFFVAGASKLFLLACERGRDVLSYCEGTLGLIGTVGMWSNVLFLFFFFFPALLFYLFVHLFNFLSDTSCRCFCEVDFKPLFCMNGIKCFTWILFFFFCFSFQNDIKNRDLFSVLCEFIPFICSRQFMHPDMKSYIFIKRSKEKLPCPAGVRAGGQRGGADPPPPP